MNQLHGLWRIIGEGNEGGLVVFDWESGLMVGRQLVFVPDSGRPKYAPFCSIRPSLDVLNNVQWEGEGMNMVGIMTNQDELGRDSCYNQDRLTSQASIDVADVGFGTPRSLSSRESPLMGSSPENSFRQAWSQFMSSSVQARSKMRRRSSRSRFLHLRHLKRIEIPVASKRHPLSGFWIAEIDEDEFEVVALTYDFRSSVAMLIGKKVCGAGHREYGSTIWKIRAAEVSHWDSKEIELSLIHI